MNLSEESLRRIKKLIAEYSLQPIEQQILEEAVECVTLIRGEPDPAMRLAGSRYGGLPDLPPSMSWPRFGADYYRPHAYLEFNMQLNLAEFPIGSPGELPHQGMLYFFATFEAQARVLFHPLSTGLKRAARPPKEDILNEGMENLKPHHLHFMVGVDVPNLLTPLDKLAENVISEDASYQLHHMAAKALRGEHSKAAGHILGTPWGHQWDFRKDAAICRLGLRESGYGEPDTLAPHRAAIDAEKGHWRLFWCVESDFEVGANYCDAGTLYAMVRDDDLQRLDFSNMNIQMTTG